MAVNRACHLLLGAFLSTAGLFANSGDAAGTFQPPSSDPSHLFTFQECAYFVANDGRLGRELWRVDPATGEPELIADITPGTKERGMDSFYPLGNRFFFIVHDPHTGGQLWRSDGQPGGHTDMVATYEPRDGQTGFKRILGDVNEHIFLHGGHREGTGATLWISDGTPAGTRALSSAEGHLLNTNAISFGSYNGAGFFGANHKSTPHLWTTDGSPEGTHPLRPFDGELWGMTELPGMGLFFPGHTSDLGTELWFTDGTAAGTRLILDIYPGKGSSDPAHMTPYVDVNPGQSPILLFSAMHPETGRELWQSDGTAEGTRIVDDLVPGAGGSEPYRIRTSPRGVYILARTPETGVELWHVSPFHSENRFSLAADIYDGVEGSNPYATVLGPDGGLWFSANNRDTGEELWYSGGAYLETFLVSDMTPGPASSEPYHTVRVGGQIVFAASHPVHGRELWSASSPQHPPRLLVDLFTDDSINPSSAPDEITPLGDIALFVADDLAHGRELWCTDGTADGTVLLKDIYPGRIGSNPEHLTRVDDFVYFSAESPGLGAELWGSDGTANGTARQLEIYPGEGKSSGPMHLTSWQGQLLFSAYRAYDGRELWTATPGQKPVQIMNIAPDDASSNPRNFVSWREHVYFLADDGIHGEELWRTDGTRAGTMMVKDLVDRPTKTLSISRITPWGDRLLLSAASQETGQELWVLDSPNAGPRLLGDLASPAALGVLIQVESER